MAGIDPPLLSMPAIDIETGAFRATSHRFMNLISSA
jgi:hypothetical protein